MAAIGLTAAIGCAPSSPDSDPDPAATGARGGNTASGGPASTGPRTTPYVPDQLLVRFRRGTGLSAAYRSHARVSTQLLRAFRFPSELQLVSLPSGMSVEEALKAYSDDPSVLYAEPNYRWSLDSVPGDPDFAELWGLHNTGQTGGTADADINAVEAWEVTTGSANTVIAVTDTGINYLHEDLAANMWVNPGEIADNGIDDDGNGYVDDVHGINALTESGDPLDDHSHGSHVAGTIAAAGDNGIGVTGVNWNAQLLGCKIFDAAGSTTTDAILRCQEYIVDLKTRPNDPVDIVASNNSWGGGPFSQALLDSIEAFRQADILFVAAAGNSNSDTDATPHYPSSYDLPNILAVMAIDHDDAKAGFSSYGRRTVDVAAPGVDILSTTLDNNYQEFSGTSMATPHVTGLVGLLESANPALTAVQIKNLIMSGGTPTEAAAAGTLSGRRIRAWGADGDGALNCVDRPLVERFAPAADDVATGVGQAVDLGVLSINCAEPSAEPVTVTVTPGDEVITLLDDGNGGDGYPGDGSFFGQFTPPGPGSYVLTFSTGDVVTVNVLEFYGLPATLEADPIVFEGEKLELGIDDVETITSPFPIPFGGADPGFDTLHISSNGNISFTDSSFTAFINQQIPTAAVETLVAPMWDDFNLPQNGGLFWTVVGAAPERQLVVEWREAPHYFNTGAATFQVVFTEGSSDVLFNYTDVEFESASFDNGNSATVGIQVASDLGTQYSFNSPSLENGQALLWQIGAPVAVAGPDQVVLGGDDVVLDGSASSDADGSIVSYEWAQIAGEPVTLSGADTPVASFVAPQASGTLTFRLTVTDDEGKIHNDDVDVVVNEPPVADAGPNQRVSTNFEVTLDGTGSSDPDGEVAGYQWTQIDGEPVTLTGGSTPIATFTSPSAPGFLVFQLTVTDELGFTDSDVVVIDVVANDAPVAVVPQDRIVRPGSDVSVDGSASHDPDGSIESYSWTVETCFAVPLGSCDVALTGADTPVVGFVAPDSAALVVLRLTVADDLGVTASDEITISVFEQSPTAAASAPEVVATGATVTLDGSASYDPDGSIVSYQWTQISGTPRTIEGSDQALASFQAQSFEQNLVFRLTVTDDSGRTGTADVAVFVNEPPEAVAGVDDAVVVTNQMVTLEGFRSTGATGYSWVQTAGTPVTLSDASAANPTFLAPAPSGAVETLRFELTVTDDFGFSDTDAIEVALTSGP